MQNLHITSPESDPETIIHPSNHIIILCLCKTRNKPTKKKKRPLLKFKLIREFAKNAGQRFRWPTALFAQRVYSHPCSVIHHHHTQSIRHRRRVPHLSRDKTKKGSIYVERYKTFASSLLHASFKC